MDQDPEASLSSKTDPEVPVASPPPVAAPAPAPAAPEQRSPSADDESRFLGAPETSFPTSFPSQPPTAIQSGALQADQLFGKFRVVRDLGAGGMAQVFLAAIDGPEGFQKQCVVKKILPEYAKDPNFASMFINEARVAAMMSHQNIVQVFEFAKENNEYFLAMEYVSGASLDRVMRTGRKVNFPLGPRVAVEVGIGMAHALGYAHAFADGEGKPLHIVHRDISPENILLSREGAVKLTDFGVVKSAMNTQATVAGMVKGKWSYMSPEQVSSLPVDHRSDLFSLGIVLYEVATGKRLFRGDSVAATVAAVMKAQVVPPSALVPNFPSQLERIILRALSRDPNARYQSGAELAAALETFRATQPWTSGGQKHLATVVNTLFPRDGSQPGVNLMPGSGASDQGVAQADDESASSINISVDEEGLSTPLLLGIGAVALLASAAFWFFLS